MKIVKALSVLGFVFWCTPGFSQKEAAIWYFGNGAGYDFNVAPPALLRNGSQEQLEGMSTICDRSGNLLFYTSGEKVWDRTHKQMPNGSGLFGSWTSTQSALIVPKPGNPDLYYIFTTDAGSYEDFDIKGLNYSLVSMCEAGGYGDVLPKTKNTLLVKPSSEKLCAVYHTNGTDIWVLTHLLDSNEFYAYLVTESGVHGPVVSSVGRVVDNLTNLGQMKFSTDGKKVAMGMYLAGVQVFDFDAASGVLTNPIFLPGSIVYGVEFSPNASRLYITLSEGEKIVQFDLTAGSEVAVQRTAKLIATANPSMEIFSALQLGIDGKVYGNDLFYIDKPDNLGSLCGFTRMPSAPLFQFQHGLDDVVQTFVDQRPVIRYDKPCESNIVSFWLTHEESVQSVKWNFDDAGPDNISLDLRPSHQYLLSREYNATAEITLKSGGILIQRKKLTWRDFTVNLGKDSAFCDVDNFLLDATQYDTACYLWQDGSTDAMFKASTTGWYWVEVRLRGCAKRDSVFLTFGHTPTADIGDDRILCEHDTLRLTQQAASQASYRWSTGETSSSISVVTPGTYWLQLSDARCISRDSVKITGQAKPHLGLPLDTTYCEGIPLMLSANPPYDDILWSNGGTDFGISIDSPRDIWVRATLNSCMSIDTVRILEIRYFSNTTVDTTICVGTTAELDVARPESTYTWSTGENSPSISVASAGAYEVTVTNHCFNLSLNFIVEQEDCTCDLFIPNVFTPNGDDKNAFFAPVINQKITDYGFQVFNRWGQEVFRTTENNGHWDGGGSDENESSGVYYYVCNYGCLRDGQNVRLEKRGYVRLSR